MTKSVKSSLESIEKLKIFKFTQKCSKIVEKSYIIPVTPEFWISAFDSAIRSGREVIGTQTSVMIARDPG